MYLSMEKHCPSLRRNLKLAGLLYMMQANGGNNILKQNYKTKHNRAPTRFTGFIEYYYLHHQHSNVYSTLCMLIFCQCLILSAGTWRLNCQEHERQSSSELKTSTRTFANGSCFLSKERMFTNVYNYYSSNDANVDCK